MKLYREQLEAAELWLMEFARPLEKAKWQVLMRDADSSLVLAELLKFQNPDGGFGNGLEADITMPDSSATATVEALFIAKGYGFLEDAPWLAQVLQYFEDTARAGKAMTWEAVPGTLDQYPHAPWWQYQADADFHPNPGAVAAAVLLIYGNERQQDLGLQEAERSLAFLMQAEEAFEHDLYCLQFLVEQLLAVQSPLITDEVIAKMKHLIQQTASFDSATWDGYVAQPLDFIDGPDSMWREAVEAGIEKNFAYWLNTFNPEGYWQPNFSWGAATDTAAYVSQIWRGVITVTRVAKLKCFGLIEE